MELIHSTHIPREALMHGNARLTPHGRRTLIERIQRAGRSRMSRHEMGISRHDRVQVVGPVPRRGLSRSRGPLEPAPVVSAPDAAQRRERRVERLRRTRKLGPARIAGIVGMPASTVHRVLVRHGLNRLRWMDRPTGRVIRRIEPTVPASWSTSTSRNSAASPPVAAGGPRAAATSSDQRDTTRSATRYVHTAIDAYSPARLQRGPRRREGRHLRSRSCERAHAWFAEHGITVDGS